MASVVGVPQAQPDHGRVNLLGMNRARLSALLAELGERPFRAVQVLKWIHQHRLDDFEGMTNLALALRQRLAECTEIRSPEIVREQCSGDGTRKWLLAVDPANRVETVFIPDGARGTLCVSSQAGCALACSFCSTARQGFSRNLDSAEIVGQLRLASARLGSSPRAGPRAITNVVLMGMGEPLLNFEAVSEALDVMLEDNAYGLARRRVTLSTAGLVPGIRRLAARCPVSLAVSLHAPDDDLRDRLVPVNRKYPIAELLGACRDYVAASPKEVITFEYVMLDGVNDSLEQARRLAARLRALPAKVNLIPFNAFPGAPYRCSPRERIDAFREVLLGAGVMTITRRTRGDDIDAACGQLAGRIEARGRRPALTRAPSVTLHPPAS